MDNHSKNDKEELHKHEQSKDEIIEVHMVQPSTGSNRVEITDPLSDLSQNLVVLQTSHQSNQSTVPLLNTTPVNLNQNSSNEETFFNSIKKKLSRKEGSAVVSGSSIPAVQSLIKEESQLLNGVRRQRSMVKPERARTIDRRKFSLKKDFMKESVKRNYSMKSNINPFPVEEKPFPTVWQIVSSVATFYFPDFVLKLMGKSTNEVRQAFREKLTLVTIITSMCFLVGFLTFGLQSILCNADTLFRLPFSTKLDNTMVSVDGVVYNVTRYIHPKVDILPEGGAINGAGNGNMFDSGGKDLSFLFQDHYSVCKEVLINPSQPKFIFPCVATHSNNQQLNELKNSNPDFKGCHQGMNRKRLTSQLKPVGDLYFSWDEIYKSNHHLVYNGNVLDVARLDWLLDSVQLSANLQQFLKHKLKTKDISYLLSNQYPEIGPCLESSLKVGVIDTQSIGCISSNIILYLSLIVIISLVLVKFFMALFFGWVMSPRLGTLEDETSESKRLRMEAIENWSNTPNLNGEGCESSVVGDYNPLQVETKARFSTYDLPNMLHSNSNSNLSKDGSTRKSYFLPQTSRFSIPLPGEAPGGKRSDRFKEASRAGSFYIRNNSSDNTFVTKTSTPRRYSRSNSITDLKNEGLDPLIALAQLRHKAPLPPDPSFKPFNFNLAHTLMLVTCYSENESGLRATFDSLALTDYPNSHKLLYVVCDGIITGHGNDKSTPDLCLGMMQDFVIDPDMVQSFSYVALASGSKRHNKAKVYAGYYKYDNSTVDVSKQVRVPMVLVVKVGTVAESTSAKPGNRGKRDGQIILMAFLQRIMFDERLSELDFEMFNAMWNVTGVPPDSYEIVLMVDADTKVYHDSLSKMVAVMVRDPSVMGLCGETKIANKSDSWVTMIQVFEYYISHHLSKAFESVFGGVTCLPGCFCMYRIKAPKGTKGYWVPILANADIVENYSENVVDTLHKKNLLLLGEDRYLTTLMLKTFPKRKMVFVPQAVCKTVVPDNFKVLLSQRRRWINSTVHNLLELVLIRDLCGTFCFSMQFVIFMELVGTVVLPAAISFTLYLLVISFIVKPAPIIPLLLLAAILGLPAVLITFTTRKMVYVGWMLVYLLSLPIWNFVLPVYAYWHFDDFSWGETRKVEGEVSGSDDHGTKEGEFDASHIVMKRWSEFERDRRVQLAKVLALLISPSNGDRPLPMDKQSRALDELGYLAPNAINQLIMDPTPLLVHLTGEKDELEELCI